MSTEVTIIKKENVELIIQNAPQSYLENQQSHDNCIKAGQKLLSEIQSVGMTDDLDQQAALFIERAKKTVKKMNDKRAPITKLFDEIRAVYTSMEGDVDPTKANTVPAQLQKLRNEYAAKKHAEAEARRREEERKQRAEIAKNTYRLAVEEDYRQSFRRMLNTKFNELTSLNNTITLDNYAQQVEAIKSFQVTLPEDWEAQLTSGAMMPTDLDMSDAINIRKDVLNGLLPKLREEYTFDIGENRDSILLTLPSKKKELEDIAQSSADEARRREDELKLREAEEARKREEERRRREEENKQQHQIKQQQNNMAGLFAQAAASASSYQPKLQVKKKLVINNPLGFLEILNLWWATEGCSLSVDDLSKKFKSQITHCEKLANDRTDPRIINSQYITYEDDIKAK